MTTDTLAHSTNEPAVEHVVVVGGGPAAHRFTETMRRRDTEDRFKVTVISEEALAPYDRVNLAKRWDRSYDLTLGDPTLWEDEHVGLVLGDRVNSIDTELRQVRTRSGTIYGYDHLVMATGSNAFTPPISGWDTKGVFVYRTVDDVDQMADCVQGMQSDENRTGSAVVLGGGLLGLEAAGGLAAEGYDVHLVELADWLMPAQLDEGGGRLLNRLIEQRGITLHMGVSLDSIEKRISSRKPSASEADALASAASNVRAVRLSDGSEIPADLVCLAVGIRPRDELAKVGGFEIGPRGGIMVGQDCATSIDRVWAIGEVAAVEGHCYGLVAPANTMAEVVVDRLLGGKAVFGEPDSSTKLKLSGIDVASFGDAKSAQKNTLDVVFADPTQGIYQKLILSSDVRVLLGGILVGNAENYSTLRAYIGRELPGDPSAYLAAGGGELPDTGDIPDEVVVCSCNNVTSGTIKCAVNGEGDFETPARDIATLKACTNAGTQCGSCVPLMQKILAAQLAKAGIAVSTALCEHFDYSRSELYAKIRENDLSTFDEVIAEYGTGHGCDVCKPTVASILASQRDRYILDRGLGELQDTNDRFIGNMQKDGTYSVVPRVPGGEITPERLRVIAEVAADFNLYTKITGAQRIGLFGARLEQLPHIWQRLVDAGMESGQAYGKSLRTVKSCVGSTWCRFGQQDSVSMAILLEERYKGLRSPHKFKLGVSGCARECAEARGKDIGVIATDKGWNLYVGGNGGFSPRHAELLASDVDDDTLVSLVDRFLGYYIRSAEKLQRTAAWIDSMDGGIDHVHAVVVEDSLGIADELEKEMQEFVDGHEDEWVATLKDPQKLARFRSFINAPEAADPLFARVPERDQNRPATLEERESVLISGPEIAFRGPRGEAIGSGRTV
ncbi:nitrite reductase large subunit NirB [Helcobacillus massiliensis]|uniref:nitrite reductase large subunit NirB n=1 Tax=Helcobacillus massiliensis TaxID=521392 RepID=UPI0021A3C9FE|nr:nitrite reductase large subunit NirB [Helcobacillus massiliensis]MCT1557193.1 nitrite reductase large subunit NirB [Helcobacillus massiliensis]MCT2036957.1 nitrite reductase large subunit NirB [Helcobacillus massiliensis]MCT2332653.1 nitrite reductase large subunit NirB [Helcobacillus massiliensis]